ncbi:glycosyltransferase family 4 protein [Bradyrhizobium sp. SYSU BS000235]|uniref:glycosyltransferase family 4 protein n=1 Tax=Bradyrhizobium sp. SYSU BS000235 TaxID=3411332 RepID=UPI003C70BD50
MSKKADFQDRHTGRPKILFVGEIHSTHAQTWIETLRGEQFDIRALALTTDDVPKSFPYPFDAPRRRIPRPALRAGATILERAVSRWKQVRSTSLYFYDRIAFGDQATAHLFKRIVRTWQPDIIHCLGLLAAGRFVVESLRGEDLRKNSKLVIQLRGGSDLALNHADAELAPKLADALRDADEILSDNVVNFELMRRMGLTVQPPAGLERVPGTGGIDLGLPVFNNLKPASQRRIILWPKAYESPWSKGMPVLEALKLAWERMLPFHLHMVMAVNELPSWIALLPEEMRQHITMHRHIPRDRLFELMREARIMLAPSLIDGTPNVMWESMAAGAVPLVSPLDTITPLVKDGENVVMARNLYPQEIADALVRAMTDDALVDRIATTNRRVVSGLAGREIFRPKILDFYRSVAASNRICS